MIRQITFLLLLRIAKSELLLKPTDTEAIVGSKVILRCRTDMTSTENPVEWHYTPDNSANFKIVYKYGQLINGYSSKMNMTSNASTGQYDLVIKHVTVEDAGAYTCLDFTSQHKAELVVFDKYPAPKFCSVKSAPADGFLGSNDCDIEPDTVELSCDLSYRGNLEVSLECSNQELITSSTTVVRNEPTTSVVQLRADQLQSPSGAITCQLKYTADKIASNMMWSTIVHINTFSNVSSVTPKSCSEESVCPPIGNNDCDYTWMTENDNVVSRGKALDLQHALNGTFICMASCKIRQNICSLAAAKVHYSCSNTQNTAEPYVNISTASNTNHLTIGLAVAITVVVMFAVAAAFLLWRYLCRNRKPSNTASDCEEGQEQENVKPLLSISKTTSETDAHSSTNNGTICIDFLNGTTVKANNGENQIDFLNGTMIQADNGTNELGFLNGTTVEANNGTNEIDFMNGTTVKASNGTNQIGFLNGTTVKANNGKNHISFLNNAVITANNT